MSAPPIMVRAKKRQMKTARWSKRLARNVAARMEMTATTPLGIESKAVCWDVKPNLATLVNRFGDNAS